LIFSIKLALSKKQDYVLHDLIHTGWIHLSLPCTSDTPNGQYH